MEFKVVQQCAEELKKQYVRTYDYISNMYVRMYVHTYLCAYSLYIMKSHNNQLQGQEAAIQVALSVANSIV